MLDMLGIISFIFFNLLSTDSLIILSKRFNDCFIAYSFKCLPFTKHFESRTIRLIHHLIFRQARVLLGSLVLVPTLSLSSKLRLLRTLAGEDKS
jgi:hypothetical protein